MDDLEELATELHRKGNCWDILQTAAGASIVAYVAWAGALRLGFRKMPLQVPYVPSTARQVENMMSLLKGRSGKFVDLGSGDGRIVCIMMDSCVIGQILELYRFGSVHNTAMSVADVRGGSQKGEPHEVLEAYKQGFRPAVGYELNPWLLQWSSFRAWRAGCYGKVFYRREDLWKADLSDCSNVTVFLAPCVVPLLERKLLAELPDEACVVAARFPFLKWTPSSVAGDGFQRAWAYSIKAVRQAERDKSRGSPPSETKLSLKTQLCMKDGTCVKSQHCFFFLSQLPKGWLTLLSLLR